MTCGLWVLSGFLIFIIAEKIFIFEKDDEDDTDDKSKLLDKELDNNNCLKVNGLHGNNAILVEGNGNNGFSKTNGYYHKATLAEVKLQEKIIF